MQLTTSGGVVPGGVAQLCEIAGTGTGNIPYLNTISTTHQLGSAIHVQRAEIGSQSWQFQIGKSAFPRAESTTSRRVGNSTSVNQQVKVRVAFTIRVFETVFRGSPARSSVLTPSFCLTVSESRTPSKEPRPAHEEFTVTGQETGSSEGHESCRL